MTKTARFYSGHSPLVDTGAALDEALAQAGCGGATPALCLCFAGPDHDLSAILRKLQGRFPGAGVLACTTGGEFTERGFSHGGLSLALVEIDGMLVQTALARDLRRDTADAAQDCCARFAELEREARARGIANGASLVLLDALSGAADPFVSELHKRTRRFQMIAGAAAGDEGRFERTRVGTGTASATDAAAVAHVFMPTAWSIAIGRGLQPTTERMLVTRAEQNILYEIEGRPAFEVYREHARKRGIELTPESAPPFMIANELGVYFLDELDHARAPLSVQRDGSLMLAGGIDRGASICILDGQPDAMIAAARRAAKEAREALKGQKVAGALLLSCVCREGILGRATVDEIRAVHEELGNVPLAGFLTYGEIARISGRLTGVHNASVVVVAIPE